MTAPVLDTLKRLSAQFLVEDLPSGTALLFPTANEMKFSYITVCIPPLKPLDSATVEKL